MTFWDVVWAIILAKMIDRIITFVWRAYMEGQ